MWLVNPYCPLGGYEPHKGRWLSDLWAITTPTGKVIRVDKNRKSYKHCYLINVTHRYKRIPYAF